MARQTKPLTDTDCRNAKPKERDFSLFDGGGLYLLIKTNGSKSWRFKFTKPSGKPGLTAFGNYPALSLSDARARREEARSLLAQGVDLAAHKQQAKLASQFSAANTFEAVALEWHAKEMAGGKWSADHAERLLQRLRDSVFPHVGAQPIDGLQTRDLLVPLQKAAERNALDLAKRIRQYITSVMRYAVQTGRIPINPALDLQGAVATRKAKHYAALPLQRLPELLGRVDSYKSRVARAAAQFALFTGARSSEFRFARWPEFDLAAAVWTIPPEREEVEGVRHSQRGEKMSRERVIYLSRQTVQLLEELRQLNGRSEFVFQGQKNGTPISENTVNLLLRAVGYNTQSDICLHGFRTMIVSALNESGRFNPDAVERHIGHEGKGRAGEAVRAIYNRNAQYLKERQMMLQWWADYLTATKEIGRHIEPSEYGQGAAVIPFQQRTA